MFYEILLKVSKVRSLASEKQIFRIIEIFLHFVLQMGFESNVKKKLIKEM